jgi:hypothetical protein
LNSLRPLSFSLSDILLVLFVHDLEKPWKLVRNTGGEVNYASELKDKDSQHAFRKKLLQDWKISLSPEQENAL